MVDEEDKPKPIKVPDLGSETLAEQTKEKEKKAAKRPKEKELDLSSIKESIQKNLKKKDSGEKHSILPNGKVPIDKPSTKKTTLIRKGKNRVATGIEGMDGIMGGGFEPGSVNIIGGGPGSGKSILCMQFLVNGAKKFNEAGIYITFEESKAKLKKHLADFNWDIDSVEKSGKLTIVQYSPDQVKTLLEEGGGVIDSIIEKTKAKRIVIDSLTAFTLLFKDELSKIKASLKLFNLIEKWRCTALLTAEADPDPRKHKARMMEFEVDGVILLYNIRKEDTRERALEILKLRGIHHSTKIFPMKITDNGMQIFPEEEFF